MECDAGKYKETQGSASCTTCDVGKFSRQVGASTEKTCIECAGGKYASREGATLCLDCVAGKSSDGVGAYRCISSAPGTPPPGEIFIVKIFFNLQLPMTKDQFNYDSQTKFKQAIANVADVRFEDVNIDKITEMKVRRVASIRIDTSVSVRGSADSILSKMTANIISSELSKVGLPEAKLLGIEKQVGIKDANSSSTSSSSPSSSSSSLPVVIGSVVGIVGVGGILAAWFCLRRRSKSNSNSFYPKPNNDHMTGEGLEHMVFQRGGEGVGGGPQVGEGKRVDAEVGLTSSGHFKNVTKPRNEDLEEKLSTLFEVDAQLCYEENLSTWFEADAQLGFVVAV